MQMIASALSTHPILAFGIPSGPDLIILLVIVLVLFGAKRLPELARGFGQSVNEFKKAKDEFDKEVAKPTSTSEPAVVATTPVMSESHGAASAPIKDDQKPV
jgi:sec-independent protein translocase protein TatA